MIVVLPFCQRDSDLLLTNLEWMAELGKQSCDCLLVSEQHNAELQELATSIFSKAIFYKLDPYSGSALWPAPQNYAFRQTAHHMYANGKEPWLWLEPDAVPLKKGWLTTIRTEYEKAGKPFMGCVIHHNRDYMAGVGVYPWNAVEYAPSAMISRAAPWDFAMAEEIRGLVHSTKLIDHRRNEGHSFKTISDLSVIHPEAVIFHKAKGGDLQMQLRRKANPLARLNPFKPRVTMTGNRYYHSGNLGDIIYALYAIKKHGGGTLLIGPEQDRTAKCSNPLSRAQFELFRPLLEAQKYVHSVDYRENYPSDATVDLNQFRRIFLDSDRSGSLCGAHFQLLNITDKFDESEPWLKVPEPIKSDRIVIARSLRHRNWFFPWGEVVKRFKDKLLFIGLPKEHEVWEMCWGKVEFRQCKDFQEMASVIAGAKGAVMNQSFPCAMAIGLGLPVLQECWDNSPDCLFNRKNFTTELERFRP